MSPVLRLDPRDNLVVARRTLAAGERLPTEGVTAAEEVPAGHKLATRSIAAGEEVLRGGLPIGIAAAAIAAGQRLRATDLLPARPLPGGLRPLPVPSTAPSTAGAPEGATFRGFVREDGRVGTRNIIGVFVVGNCGATAARQAADWFDEERLARFPNVDGVVPYIHEIGCGMEMTGEPMDLLRRTISGFIRNPNTAGAVVVALGCERNNLKVFLEQEKLAVGDRLHTVVLQDIGGVRKAVEAAKGMVESMLPAADAARRQEVPASHLVLGLQCGAPDGFTGLSANPALGVAVDLLVRAGGTAILSETPEVLMMEEAFLARTGTPALAEALRARLDWWRDYNRGKDTQLNGVLDRGHAAAGLASVLEKSLDGALKAGTAPISGVFRYGERVTGPGLVFMDTPDYDPVSVTGQIAGGATMIAMTTGRGTPFGSLPAPTLKIASNSETYRRMADDIDLDCGPVLDGTASVEEMGRRIFDALLRHASGEKTKGEIEGAGESEFVPWPIGVFA
ncbi:altronate dehydratase [Roseomonas sp. SSH11]|uniref:Altronate dehydratase n=1 Tax=Pararoseomonas baculiformis TaxID=2820812 RepID=A0ABS4AJT4_9PROT|nr:altronate dehydratase family protein [Pararoseomonas baculiformis]MBP0447299.1 altronate dehydratase [Pararoseomonas baculiformis]